MYTVSNLVIAIEFITRGIEDRAQVDAVYTDYSKCFDLNVLLKNLMAAGIKANQLL